MKVNLEGLLARRVWLQKALVDLDRNIVVAPRLLFLNVLAIPAWFIWNYQVAIAVAVVAVGLSFTTFYVAWIHRRQCGQELEGLDAELSRRDAESAPVGSAT